MFSKGINKSMIDASAKVFPGSSISGARSSIGPNCIIGEEGPVVIENCQLGKNVQLKSGYFKDSVFLDGSSIGSFAHVRKGTLLEEQSKAANYVGFKETILFPFVTTGSLINFCDALISGGTDTKNHSEIGSSYIHFNYTVHKDKATPSLFGNVEDGIFLDQNPIFLGGQGGAVGPIQIAFGSKVAAGSILRKNYSIPNQIISEPHIKEYEKEFVSNHRNNIDRIIENNFTYIGNIAALYAWYKEVRVHYIQDKFDKAVHQGAIQLLNASFKERIKQMNTITNFKCDANLPIISSPPNELLHNIKNTGEYLLDIKNIKPDIKKTSKHWIRKIIQDNINLFRG